MVSWKRTELWLKDGNKKKDTQIGLPFSDKKIIPQYTEQDGTDSSSVGIPPALRKRKTSEFRSKPFLGREKPLEFRSKPFLDEKNLGILFRTIFGREKTLEFRSESLLEEKILWNSVPNHFRKRKDYFC